MTYGYIEYSKIKRLLDKYDVVFQSDKYDSFIKELIDIFKL